MSRMVRVDRRYRNPYRLTGYGKLMLFKWIGLAALVIVLGTTARYVGLVCLVLYIAYAVWSFVRMRRRRLQPSTQAVAAAIVGSAPLGERNSRNIPQDVKVAVSVRDGGKCRQCGSTKELHYDHVIPWSRGGANTINNIQLLCGPCNRRKGAKDSVPV